ncbi:MAG: AMP-binding protein [Nocardioides sp.]
MNRAASEAPSRPAIVEADGRSLTWAELDDEVGRVATGLGEIGIVAGHRVLIALGNRLEFVTAYLGVLRAQAVAVPVNPRSSEDELARMVADSGARLAVADGDTLDAVRAAVAAVAAALSGTIEESAIDVDVLSRAASRTVVVVVDEAPEPGERSFADLRAAAPRPVTPLPDPEKVAVLLYTSGTSGRPRAAILTHRALLANIEQVSRIEPPMIHADDVILAVLPLFHVYGLNAVLGGAVRHAATVVLQQRFDPQGTLDLIAARGATVVPLAPTVFGHWLPLPDLRERLTGVRLVLSGSAPLGREVIEEFEAVTGIPVHQGYGLTEAAPVVTSTLCSGRHQPASVGAALDGVELRLVDEHGNPVEGNDPGEIEIRGANLFAGYWPDGSDAPGEEGWWATGDVGILDHAGDLFLVARLPGLVLVSGFNIYPHGVEDVIRETEGITEAAVIGVADDATGEAVVAYVVAPGLDTGRGRRTPAVRGPAGPVQAAVADRDRREPAALGDRQGPEGPAARPRAAPVPGAPGVSEPGTARVTLYGRPGCHLCDDARAVIEKVCADLGESFEELSIDDDEELARRYREEIPVTLVDGRRHDFWRVDETRLRAALA